MAPHPSKRRFRLLLVAESLALLAMIGLAISGFFFLKAKWFAVREPVLIEVVASYPGASAEEVERQVLIPLEVGLAGMPRLKVVRSKSVCGLARLQAEFEDRAPYDAARQMVINRLAMTCALPAGVSPILSPADAHPATFRYTLQSPLDQTGRPVYTLNDLRALQDWVIEREFRRVPRILDAVGCGGTVRRYEIQPDPDRLRRYGITLEQLQNAVVHSNGNVGGDNAIPDLMARGIGLFGGGVDPTEKARGMESPPAAAAHLRAEEQRRIREIRDLVIATVNNVPVHVGDVVEGGPLRPGDGQSASGVVVACRPRQGQVGVSRMRTDGEGRPIRDERGDAIWDDNDDCVRGVVTLCHGEDAEIAWCDVRAKIEQLNAEGKLLPGVRLEPYLEGNGPPDHFWVRSLFPVDSSREAAAALAGRARALIRGYPEVEKVISEVGGTEDGLTPMDFDAGQLCVILRPAREWPTGTNHNRPRTKAELMEAIAAELDQKLAGAAWDCSTQPREGLWGEFAGDADEAVLKIIGPDLDELEKLAGLARSRLQEVAGVRSVRILPVQGQTHLVFRVDSQKCARWGVPAADVQEVVRTALTGSTRTSMVEGEKTFDISVRWPARLRQNEESILDLPLDIVNNELVPAQGPAAAPPDGPIGTAPRLRLRDLVSPLGKDGEPDPGGAFTRTVAAAIYREQGQRLILLRVGVRGRQQAAVRREGDSKVAPLLEAGYRLDWKN